MGSISCFTSILTLILRFCVKVDPNSQVMLPFSLLLHVPGVHSYFKVPLNFLVVVVSVIYTLRVNNWINRTTMWNTTNLLQFHLIVLISFLVVYYNLDRMIL